MRNLIQVYRILVCTGLVIVTSGINAAWDLAPAAQIETSLEDNVRMSTEDKDSALVSSITGQVKLRNITETSRISATAGLSFLKYSGAKGLDDQDIQFLDFSAINNGEKTRLGFAASYRRDVMLRRSKLIPDFGGGTFGADIPGDDALVEDDLALLNTDPDLDDSTSRLQIRRERIRISPTLTWNLTERTSARVTLNYSELKYGQNAIAVGLRDSESKSVKLAIRRRISDKDNLALTGSARTHKPGQNPESQNYELRASWNHRYSERSRFGIQLGARRTERDAGISQSSSSETGFTFKINGSRSYERTSIRASAERSIYPSAFGQLVETDRITLDINRTVSPRMNMDLQARAFSTDTGSDAGTTGRGDQDYLQIGPSMNYRLSPAFTARLSYQYTWVDRNRTDLVDAGSASGNSISLAFSYTPPRPI